ARALLTLAQGEIGEAERLLDDAFRLGERSQPDMAIPVHRLQRYGVFELRGVIEQVEPSLQDLVDSYPWRPVFRCALTHLAAQLGRLEEARRQLTELTRSDVEALPFDQEWLYGMSLLAETAALVGDTDAALLLHRLLEPWAALNAYDHPEGFRGSVSRYLGLLASMLQRFDDTLRHSDLP